MSLRDKYRKERQTANGGKLPPFKGDVSPSGQMFGEPSLSQRSARSSARGQPSARASTAPPLGAAAEEGNNEPAKPLTRREMYEKRMRERQQGAADTGSSSTTAGPKPILEVAAEEEAPTVAPKLVTHQVEKKQSFTPVDPFAPTATDLARKAYLAEARARNDASKKQFEDRVKGYFAKGLEIEKQKIAQGSVGGKSKKDQNHEMVESGLFLQQLKGIGLDVGKMATATKKMKPGGDDYGSSRGAGGYSAPAETSYSSYSSGGYNGSSGGSYGGGGGYSAPAETSYSSYGGGGGGFGGGSETRLASLEMSIGVLQRTLNDQDKKLDMVIELQRQMLSLMKANGNAGGGGSGGDDLSISSMAEHTPQDTGGGYRRNRRR